MRGMWAEGVEKIVFPEEDMWKVDIQQSGGTERREGVTIDPSNEEEIPNSKGTANFLIKWDGAKAASTITAVASDVRQAGASSGGDTFKVNASKGH